MNISPNTILDINTLVSVGNRRGYVVNAVIEKDQFNSPIAVHTIHFTSKFSHKRFDKNGNVKMVYIPTNTAKIQRVNYASINVLEDNK